VTAIHVYTDPLNREIRVTRCTSVEPDEPGMGCACPTIPDAPSRRWRTLGGFPSIEQGAQAILNIRRNWWKKADDKAAAAQTECSSVMAKLMGPYAGHVAGAAPPPTVNFGNSPAEPADEDWGAFNCPEDEEFVQRVKEAIETARALSAIQAVE
jgi:hypothetical protein